MLEGAFSKYGKITKFEMERGFAFVTFESEEASRKALETENGKKYGNRCLCLFFFLLHPLSLSLPDATTSSTTLDLRLPAP